MGQKIFFNAIVAHLNVPINYHLDGMDPLDTIFDYMETMYILL